MLGWFKKSTKKLEPIDFTAVSVDIHSHLLPGIDDGAKDLEDSVMMIKELKSLGFNKISCPSRTDLSIEICSNDSLSMK